MQCKAFKFGRLASSQFSSKMQELNNFLSQVEVIGTPVSAASDEEGTLLFVFFKEKQQPNDEKPESSKALGGKK